MKIIVALIILQLLTNIILDKTGISKKYFSSSGGFIFTIFSALWIICSLFISYDIIPDYFGGDFWIFTFWIPWFSMIIIAPIIVLVVQLVYSYIIKRLIIKNY